MENDIRLTKLQSLGLWCFYIILITSFVFGGYYFYTDLFSVYPIEKEITMDIGNTHQIELLPKNSKYFDYKNYVYEVADEKIAKINELGEIETK